MIVDTSALAAIAFGDAERETFEDLILQTPGTLTSAAVVLELEVILRMRSPSLDSGAVDRLVDLLGLDVVAFDGAQAKLARAAFATYGHGTTASSWAWPGPGTFRSCSRAAVSR
jgi:ribonuclease VapC